MKKNIFILSLLTVLILLRQTNYWPSSAAMLSPKTIFNNPDIAGKEDKTLPSRSLTIDKSAYNLMAEPALAKLIAKIKTDSKKPDSYLAAYLANNALNNFSLRRGLKKIGRTFGLQGQTIYYPFGGFDPHTPFWMVQDARDVFSFGLDKAGSLSDFEKLAEGLLEQLIQDKEKDYLNLTSNLDAEVAYEKLAQEYQLDGSGIIALLRIMLFMQGDIQGVYFFDVNQKGAITFSDQESSRQKKSFPNMVIEFTVKGPDGQPVKKRYWYKSHNLKRFRRFSKFLEKFKFEVMLLKGVMSSWNTDAVKTALVPAKRNNAIVSTDKLIEPVIWKNAPKSFRLDSFPETKNIAFGYTSGPSGEKIYLGEGKDLIGSLKEINPQLTADISGSVSGVRESTLEYLINALRSLFGRSNLLDPSVKGVTRANNNLEEIKAGYFYRLRSA